MTQKVRQDAQATRDASQSQGDAAGAANGPRQPRRRKDTRNADGDGSLYFDKKRGLWVGELMVGWRADAKDPKKRRRDVRKVAAKKQADCRAKLQRLRHEHGTGTLPDQPARDNVAAFVERWIAAKAGTVRERTHTRYAELLRRHVVPALGKTRLPALKPDAVQRLYAEKLASGLAPRSVHHIHTVLHNALEDAVRWGHVGRNVADVVEPPAVPAPELRWPTSDELARLLTASAAHRDRLEALWTVAAYTGCRVGELLALTWDDVDLDAGALTVNRILVKVVAQVPTWGEPKTKRSRRLVPLTPAATAALRRHHTRQAQERLRLGADYGPYNLVFATIFGTPISHSVALVYFKRALGWAKLPAEIRIHDLRHAAATLMLGNGVDVPTVARVLGHARNSTTLDVYGHVVPANLASAVAALQRAIGGA